MKRILFVLGSLRENSFNGRLMQEAERALEGKALIDHAAIADLPTFNQDTEFPTPAAIIREREKVEAADGIWIFTPEYNGQIPGTLKNYFDWMSRPTEYMNFAAGCIMKDKPAAVSSASGRSAGAGVRAKMLEMLPYLKVEVVSNEGFSVAPEAFGTDEWSIADDVATALSAQADTLLDSLS